MTKTPSQSSTIRVYHGYGHKDNLIVYGHVLAGNPSHSNRYTRNIIYNIAHLVKLFFVKPLPHVRLHLQWQEQHIYSISEADGFFKFEWQSFSDVPAGWHSITVQLLNPQGQYIAQADGKIFIPHATQFGFISDIDDTVLVSHSSATGKKLTTLFTTNPRSRKTFSDVVRYYQLLCYSNAEPNVPNPFFYVSSSEWNLYEYLNEFFKFNDLPKGVFLLNGIKQWHELLKTGKPKGLEKLARIERILHAFPKQYFILLGDNSQYDPHIYATLANHYPDRIVAIYLRHISHKRKQATSDVLASIQNKKIHTLVFMHTDEAILHSRSIGLISDTLGVVS